MGQIIAGLVIALATWLGLRAQVGAHPLGRREPGRMAILALDALAPFAGLLLFTLPTARPVLAGLTVMCLGIGMAVTDRVKRIVLDEPVVFADRAELIELVRHPKLYLAFVGVGWVLLAVVAIAAAIAAMIYIEPPLWHMTLPQAAALAGVAALIGRLLFVIPTAPPLMRALARFYDRLAPSREPKTDAARFGLLAACAIQATLARVERPGRQLAAQLRPWPTVPDDTGPIVILQGESFVDARRLDPSLAGHLPGFARLTEEAYSHGLLEVPCWGANTIRSELAVLAGLGTGDIGLDRYNPYEHFARVSLPSLAQSARAAGYRTICLHPYTREFYARDQVMPLLGFQEFVGLEGFDDAPRVGHYVSDVALAERAAALVRQHGPKVLVFIITMENHGPWADGDDAIAATPLPEGWRGARDAGAIGRWLSHLRATDAMIPILRDAIGGRGWLMVYGDHQPSLAGAFHAPGAQDRRTDYAIWSPSASPGGRTDRAAEELAAVLLGGIAPR